MGFLARLRLVLPSLDFFSVSFSSCHVSWTPPSFICASLNPPLHSRSVDLQLGFIGVVNRSQQDIMDDKTIESARAAEADFVESHPQYRTIAHRMGTQYLGKTLNKVLLWACWELGAGSWKGCGGGVFSVVGLLQSATPCPSLVLLLDGNKMILILCLPLLFSSLFVVWCAQLLMEHIKACLPVLRKHIHAMAKRERDELKALGTPVENPQVG